jgi:hypothetical protein
MALFTYMRRVQRYVRDERVQMISPADLIYFINEARNQIAGEADCCRYILTMATVANQRSYNFTDVSLAPVPGADAILNVRTMWVKNSTGQTYIQPKTYEQFSLFNLNTSTPQSGSPTVWAQYGQGSYGTISFDPIPSSVFTVNMDCSLSPISLAADTDPEIVPFMWTEAVAYYATYLVLTSMTAGMNSPESDAMYKRYETYVAKARHAATPATVPWLFEQVPVPGGLNPPPRTPG